MKQTSDNKQDSKQDSKQDDKQDSSQDNDQAEKAQGDTAKEQPSQSPDVQADVKPKVPENADLILDALFSDPGYYEEEVTLPGGRKCVFRTRSTKDAVIRNELLDKAEIRTSARYQHLLLIHYLAASLVRVDKEIMPDDYEKKLEVINRLPAPVADILLVELGKFDEKITAVYTPEQVKN